MSIRTWCGAVLLASMACVTALAGPAAAAGPWKIQIVDAETKQPIDGVVVLAVWYRSVDGHLYRYLDSEETVTDANGRAMIAGRTLRSGSGAEVIGPDMTIFKPGYRRLWDFQGAQAWKPGEWWHREEAWKRMTREGVVLELPPAKTREERRRALPERPMLMPWTRMARLLEAINRERRFLGLEPFNVPTTED